MYHFNIILTEFCNANCSHCYMSSDKNIKKKSLSINQIDIIVSKLPHNTKTVTLTGGEVFLVRDLLEYTIKVLKTKLPEVKIEIESNGIYLYNNDTKKILEYCKSIGVDSIRFSLDPFHRDGGVDLEKVKNIKNYESENTPVIRFLIQDKALALGKGAKLSKSEQIQMNCMNSKKTEFEPYLFLDIHGNVYMCAWKCIPSIGNLINDEFSDIENNLNNEFNKLILTGRIEEAIAYKKNLDTEELKKLSLKNGQCYLCIKKYWG